MNNAAITATLSQLQAATTTLSQTTAALSDQVTQFASELVGVAAILESLKDDMENIKVNQVAPAKKQPRVEAANGC